MLNVTLRHSLLESVMDVADELGGIDTMVNNAGVFRSEEFLEVDPEGYDFIMYIKAVLLGLKQLLSGLSTVVPEQLSTYPVYQE